MLVREYIFTLGGIHLRALYIKETTVRDVMVSSEDSVGSELLM